MQIKSSMSASLFRDARWRRFLLVGGLCFFTNLMVLYVGTELVGLHYLVSTFFSIFVTNTLGWVLNRKWTFASSSSNWLLEYGRYLTVSLSGFAFSLGLMTLLVSGAGVHYLLASASIAVGMTVVNFAAHRGWSFARRD